MFELPNCYVSKMNNSIEKFLIDIQLYWLLLKLTYTQPGYTEPLRTGEHFLVHYILMNAFRKPLTAEVNFAGSSR